MFQNTLGTVEIAKMIGMSRITVHSWIAKGALRAVRTPGRHYRVEPDDLVEFLRGRGAPVPDRLCQDAGRFCVLIDRDSITTRQIVRLLSEPSDGGPVRMEVYHSPMAALMAIGEARPSLVVTQMVLNGFDTYDMVREIRRRYVDMKILTLDSGMPGSIVEAAFDAGADDALEAPFSAEDIVQRIHEMTG